MFKGFNIDKFKKMKPPPDNSFTTMQEVKHLKTIPLNKSVVKKFDDIESTFKSVANKNNIKDYDAKLVAKVIEESDVCSKCHEHCEIINI